MSTAEFTIGDTRRLTYTLKRAGTPIDLDAETPQIRFRATGKWGQSTYGFTRDNLSEAGGIVVVDGPAGIIRIPWSAAQTASFPAIKKSEFIALTLELELTTVTNGVETVEIDLDTLRARGQMIVPAA